MKKILASLFIIFIITEISFAQEYYPNRIIVKIKNIKAAPDYINIIENDLQIIELTPLLGSHSVKTFLDKRLLNSLNRPVQSFSQEHKTGNTIYENLSRILIIEYNSPIDPKTASGKISSFSWVEYAEPVFTHQILGKPNDPLIDQQYYLEKIRAFDAWDEVDTSKNILIGIIDTGVDMNHKDIKNNLYVNPGETGKDKNNNDKRYNSIDDDGNGFVDDWRGWDFYSSTSQDNQDNDPSPGHQHGTHVAGTAAAVTNNSFGTAAVAPSAKILPVKIGTDNPFGTSVFNSFDGIMYAAIMGADVINCSWGSPNKSNAEEEIIKAVESLGSVVVAAAGNDGENQAYYPAAYSNAISVAAVDSNDWKPYFSNYHYTVDVSAPGVGILAPIPFDTLFRTMDGTSMASPVTAGTAALVKLKFPDFSPIQIAEQIKATTDNIDSINISRIGKMGTGRVNAYRAVTDMNTKAVIISDFNVDNVDGSGILDVEDEAVAEIRIINVLKPLKNVRLEVKSGSFYKPKFIDSVFYLGDLETGQQINIGKPARFILPEWLPLDYDMELNIMVTDDAGYEGKFIKSFTVRPSYRIMDANNLSVTFNSQGNIGFNDYPDNLQGGGFEYKNSLNLMYEGALMIGLSEDRISDGARGNDQSEKDYYFYTENLFTLDDPGEKAALEGDAEFFDQSNDSSEVGVEVLHKVYQFDSSGQENFIITSYDIINTSEEDFDSLYAALFFDWDIGPAGTNNIVSFENDLYFGYVKNVKSDTLPLTGALLLSSQELNYFAIDNDGDTEDNPGVWDGFTKREKWKMMTGGIARRESRITDASMVIGAGPFSLKSGDTTRVAFSLFAADNMEHLRLAAINSRETAKEYGIAEGGFQGLPTKDMLLDVFPNPVHNGGMNFKFKLADTRTVNVDIYDLTGKHIMNLINSKKYNPGIYTVGIDFSGNCIGTYVVKLTTENGTFFKRFMVLN